MITKEQVLDALKDVKDPEINKTLVEMNMIRNIQVSEQNDVRLEVVLTIQGCPLKTLIASDIQKRLERMGARSVDLKWGAMTEEERAALAVKLRQERESGPARTQTSQKSQPKTEQGMPQQGTPQVSPLLQPGSKTQFLAIASGKGGVGKSTVTVNLAVALARMGKKVGIIDADIYGFSIPDMMGIDQRPTVIDDLILPVERYGVKVISMAFFVKDNTPVVWRGPMLGKMLRNFFSEIYWEELDYLLLDLPPGTGDVALDVHQLIPQSKEIIVTTPHPTAAFVAARAGAMALYTTKHEVLGIVENMAYYECDNCGHRQYLFGKGGGERLASELGVELLGQIPLGAPESNPGDEDGAPAVYEEGNKTSDIFKKIAERVLEKTSAVGRKAL